MTEEEKKIEAFIRKKGVTTLPGMGTKELAEMNRQREEAWKAMSQTEKRIAMGLNKRRLAPKLTPEQKQERRNEYMRNYQRERRGRQRQA